MSTPIVSRIYLIGPRACGKTTVGTQLASRLGFNFADTDTVVTQVAGCDVATIVEREGWEGFRDREQAALDALSDSKGIVIATGGGMVLREANRVLMRKRGTVFRLVIPAATAAARLAADPLEAQRPSLTGSSVTQEAERVMQEREPLYHETAHHELDGTHSVEELLDTIQELLESDGKNALCTIP